MFPKEKSTPLPPSVPPACHLRPSKRTKTTKITKKRTSNNFGPLSKIHSYEPSSCRQRRTAQCLPTWRWGRRKSAFRVLGSWPLWQGRQLQEAAAILRPPPAPPAAPRSAPPAAPPAPPPPPPAQGSEKSADPHQASDRPPLVSFAMLSVVFLFGPFQKWQVQPSAGRG